MRRSPRTRLLTASVAMVAAFALAACGGDDDDDDTSATSASLTVESVEPDETVATDGTDETGGTTDVPTGSSGGGEVGDRQEYVDAAVAQLQMEDEDAADCVAEAIVSDDVFAQIEELGVTVDGFSETGPAGQGVTIDEDQAREMADELTGCGDIAQLLLDGDDLTCAEDTMTNDQMAQYLSFSLFGVDPDEELQEAFGAMQACTTGTATTTS